MRTYVYKGYRTSSLVELKEYLFNHDGKILPTVPPDDLLIGLGVRFEEVEEYGFNIEQLRKSRLSKLKASFEQKRQSRNIYFESSLGFKANANEASVVNISTLCSMLEYQGQGARYSTDTRVDLPNHDYKVFKTFDNDYQALTLDQLKTLRYEIGVSSELFYKLYWSMVEKLKNAKTVGEILAVDTSLPDCVLYSN